MERRSKRLEFSKEGLKNIISNTAWLYKYLFEHYGFKFLGVILVNVSTPLSNLLKAFIFARLLDFLVQYGIDNSALLSESYLWILIIALLLTMLGEFVFRRLGKYNQKVFAFKEELDFRKFLYGKIAELDIEYFEDRNFANKVDKALQATRIVYNFTSASLALLTSLVIVFSSGVLLVHLSPWLILVGILFTFPSALLNVFYVEKSWQNQRKLQLYTRFFGQSLQDLINPRKIYEHKVSDSRNLLRQIIDRYADKAVRIRRSFEMWFLKRVSLTYLSIVTGYLFVLLSLFNKFIVGVFSVGDVTFYWQVSQRFFSSLGEFASYFSSILDMSIDVSNFRQIIDSKPVIKSGSKTLDNTKPPKIEFRNVYFKYPKGEEMVLENINFVINPGENVAFVGHNGAGKTTIIKLLLRFYDVTKGQILIDNVPIQEYDLESLRGAFASLFQEFNIYIMATIQQNVMFTNDDIQLFWKSLEMADAVDLVKQLPYQERSRLHYRYPNGVMLSTGQLQKIAIARIFANSAPVFILDEPTASIDAMAEFKIFNNIYDYMAEKTVIIISHRFSTIRKAKRIFVIDNGRIVEEGTHKELLSKGGLYAKSYNVQVKELR